MTSATVNTHAIPYRVPEQWIAYDLRGIFQALVDAKTAINSLRATPYQRDWVEKLQEMQLKMEVEGTSRIEGAEFTDRELEAALDSNQSTNDLVTRSQKQARAAAGTYRWIAELEDGQPITEALVAEIHRRMVAGCDDDHCSPGKLRRADENVTFGYPRHRGCDGGNLCAKAFSSLIRAVNNEYKANDPLVQAIALHYHFAAMHPFLDGNGRTARALEALILQRAGLRDTAFIAMSNYYYEEKTEYLRVLAEVRAERHDLTAFLKFSLKGVAIQCQRLFGEIKHQIQKAVFRNMMYDLFNRLESPRKRVLAERQIGILKILLDRRQIGLNDLIRQTVSVYSRLQTPQKALIRDINSLLVLGAIGVTRSDDRWTITINLDWPEQITETDFIRTAKKLPRGKMHSFLS